MRDWSGWLIFVAGWNELVIGVIGLFERRARARVRPLMDAILGILSGVGGLGGSELLRVLAELGWVWWCRGGFRCQGSVNWDSPEA